MNNDSLDDIFGDDSATDIQQNEYHDVLIQYKKKFGHTIPIYMLPEDVSLDEIYKRAKLCVENDDDNLMELFGVKVDEDALY